MEWSAVEERDITLNDAKNADEVFITSSMRDIQAVERWDDQIFASMRPVTQTLALSFAERSEEFDGMSASTVPATGRPGYGVIHRSCPQCMTRRG